MTTPPKWIQYKTHSGFLVRGDEPFAAPVNPAMHIDRAVWLSGQLEAPKWGGVQGYDGCGLSGGILHNIAVSPKTLQQGTFFALIRVVLDSIKTAHDAGGVTYRTETAREIEHLLLNMGWQLDLDGKLRNNGTLVQGASIRTLFGDRDGKVPKVGPDAERGKRIAVMFSDLLSAPATYAAQSRYAARWLTQGSGVLELNAYNRIAMGDRFDSVIGIPTNAIPPDLDLAMCVYHAFSVNAPGPAQECLTKVVDETTSERFAKRLIRLLGTKKYGRWQDEPGDGSNRYDRTRKAVWSSGLWELGRAKLLMPRDL